MIHNGKYKMRAETRWDALTLMKKLGNTGYIYSYIQEPRPDVEMVFTSNLAIDQLRDIISTIPDNYIMLQSIDHEQQYTGMRYYNI